MVFGYEDNLIRVVLLKMVVINAEAHRNFGDQASGRLRRHEDGSTCYYCEFVDLGFKNIHNQWKSRRKHYADIFKEVITIKV